MTAVAMLPTVVSGDVIPTLDECEEVIEHHQRTFREAGFALMAIREHRLYQEEYGTFAKYCYARWGFTRQRAHQLVAAATMSTTVDIENERQARRLRAVEEAPNDVVVRDEWRALAGVMDAIEQLTTCDANEVAATVPSRRRAATARRLRRLGTFLGRIAWTLEGNEGTE